MNEAERDFIISLFEQSAAIYCPPPVYWKDPAGYQVWARARNLFTIERGIMSTPDDTSVAGRKEFSRRRLSLKASGLIQVTPITATSVSVCLTVAGLALAEKLTGAKAPAALRAVIKAMEPATVKRHRIPKPKKAAAHE